MRTWWRTGAAMVAAAGALLAGAAFAQDKRVLVRPFEKVAVAKEIKSRLKDPDSAHFKWTKFKSSGLYCAWVNAKNAFGGYTGFTPFIVLIADFSDNLAKAVALPDDDPDFTIQYCKSQGSDIDSDPPLD